MSTKEYTRNCNYNECEYDVLQHFIQENFDLHSHKTFGFLRNPLGCFVILKNRNSDSYGVGIEETQDACDFFEINVSVIWVISTN